MYLPTVFMYIKKPVLWIRIRSDPELAFFLDSNIRFRDLNPYLATQNGTVAECAFFSFFLVTKYYTTSVALYFSQKKNLGQIRSNPNTNPKFTVKLDPEKNQFRIHNTDRNLVTIEFVL